MFITLAVVFLYALALISFISIVYMMTISNFDTAILLSFIALPILVFIIHGIIIFSIKDYRITILEPLLKIKEKEDVSYIVITMGSVFLYFTIMTFLFPEYYIGHLFVSGFMIGFAITIFIRDSYLIWKIKRRIKKKD